MTEADIQRAIVTYLRTVMPKAIVHHSGAEGNRGGTRGMLDGKRRKAMGQLPGWPDLQVITFVGSLFFEVKTKTGRVSTAQAFMHKSLREMGCRVAVVRSIDDVRAALVEWEIGFVERIELRGQI